MLVLSRASEIGQRLVIGVMDVVRFHVCNVEKRARQHIARITVDEIRHKSGRTNPFQHFGQGKQMGRSHIQRAERIRPRPESPPESVYGPYRRRIGRKRSVVGAKTATHENPSRTWSSRCVPLLGRRYRAGSASHSLARAGIQI